MSNFPKVALVASILVLAACQLPSNRHSSQIPNQIQDKAIAALKSQLNLPANIAITVTSEVSLALSQTDICQTTAPTQLGFQLVLQAEEILYTLHANQDGSAIELCGSQDANTEIKLKYTGAGYTVNYPTGWQVEDRGLEPTGISQVRFYPQNDEQQYVVISRSPTSLETAPQISHSEPNLKNWKTQPYDVSVFGAESGVIQEYTQTITDTSGQKKDWQVKVLLIKLNNFVYKIQYFATPSLSSPSSPNKTFESFINSFTLIK